MMDFYEYEELLEEENRQNLQHWGIPKMKWGIRRFQNYDGTLTPAGRERYGVGEGKKQGSETNSNSNSNSNSTPKKRNIRDLSNEELREKTERLRLENEFTRQSYAQLQLAQGPQIQQGKSFLQKAADLSKTINTLAVNTNSILRVFTGKDIATMIGAKAGIDVKQAKDAANSDAIKKLKSDIASEIDKSLKKTNEKKAKSEAKKEAKEDKKKETSSDEKKEGYGLVGNKWGKERGKESKEDKKKVGESGTERSYWDSSDVNGKMSYSSAIKTETYRESGKGKTKFVDVGTDFVGQLLDTNTDYASYVQGDEAQVDLSSAEDWLKKIGAY